ncbi:MAG: hypothetical protein ACK4KV_24205 [Rhodocyclaceae bacterium]
MAILVELPVIDRRLPKPGSRADVEVAKVSDGEGVPGWCLMCYPFAAASKRLVHLVGNAEDICKPFC